MNNIKIGIVGLGYVGLPLAVEFSKKYFTVGFDIKIERINSLIKFKDETLEIEPENLKNCVVNGSDYENKREGLFLTNNTKALQDCNFFIVTVPTPIDRNNKPDLSPLISASKLVGSLLKNGDVVVFESTVFPGATEDVCVPILENESGLIFNKDFFCGYSPERINPGDKEHTVSKILKITSGSTKESAQLIDNLYKSVITAGTHLAPSIKVAEAAKVIENSQRDINIAFINELAKIFSLIGIDTNEVLLAAGTKWNFLNFKPGLVGGHCIGVDPYYLAQKAEEMGYHPEIILAGRRVNDSMAKFVATQVIKLMIKKSINIVGSKLLILGVTFKENCPDIRNTKIIDIINELEDYGVNVTIYDPWVNPSVLMLEYGKISINNVDQIDYSFDSVILGVSHNEFLNLDVSTFLKQKSVVYDIKGILPKEIVDLTL